MKIVIATPVDGADVATARVTVGYHHFVKRLAVSLGADVLPAELLFGADVVRARNRAAASILQNYPSADRVLWLDEDTWLEDMGAVTRMAETGEDSDLRAVHEQVGAAAVDPSAPRSVPRARGRRAACRAGRLRCDHDEHGVPP